MLKKLAGLLVLCALPVAACTERSDATEVRTTRTQETELKAAERALTEGRPWEASRLLMPLLKDSSRRTPDVVLVAASAAAQWGGWAEVERLLRAEPWLDTRAGGQGRWLLARSAFERRQDSIALRELRLAIPDVRKASAERVILLARVLDRLDQRDSARVAYERAATLQPGFAADWLRLRAAGVTGDSAGRAAYYRQVRGLAARERIRWTEAQARERFRDFEGAAPIFTSLGAHATALRLRVYAASDTTEKQLLRRKGVALVADEKISADEARTAIEVLDLLFAPLTPAEELVVGRRAANTGPATRADQAFTRAFSAGLGTPDDRMTHAGVLFRLGKNTEAATQYARVTARALAAQAGYQRARALLRAGKGDEARGILERVRTTYATDTATASAALYLLADLATDDGKDAEARTLFRELIRRYPSSTQVPQAAFRAALIAFIGDDTRTAAKEFDELAARKGPSGEVLSSMYWSGRAHAAIGDSAIARERWKAVIARDPLSYYALTAARRLGEAPWAPSAAGAPPPRMADVDSAMARASFLDQVGMPTEARFEYDRIMADASKSPERLLATAFAMQTYDEGPRAIRLAGQIFARGASGAGDANVYRLMYPFTSFGALRTEAAKRDLDYALIAAIIRQESSFNPRAVSAPGAVGLMQLMPPVARELSRSLSFPMWDNALLYQPDVNIQLGVAHFAGYMRRYADVAYALAAYNAGSSRVARWLTKAGARDPEVFIERIPFVETRDYVRIVTRNRAMYQALYPASGQ